MILKDPAGETLTLEGRLEGASVPDLVHAICVPGRTGLLRLTQGAITKDIYVRKGQLIFAASNLTEERLGETLLRSGVIGYRQHDEAVARLGRGKRLGTILVELGHLDPSNLVRGLLHQVKEIILSVFPWSSGSYRFVEGPLPTEELITLNIATPKLICDGIRRITSWPRIVRAVGSSRAAYRLTRDGRLLAAELDPGEGERAILAILEEPVSVGRICHSVFLPNFDVYQHLWAFRILGIVRPVEPDPDRPEPGTVPGELHGNIAETSVMELLLRLARAEETGVLHLANGDEEKTVHLKEGVVSFATSNRPDESLTTFLLRRGVIALRDKEEIERRRLTNKRVGTILRDMGILSHDELVRFVREQLAEIVLGAMPWESGDWRFLPGELPTLEAITLDRPVGELILQGIRGVRDWDRVRAGCGDLDCRLGPAPWIREALTGIEMSPDEKSILALVEAPRTVGEICGASEVSDFRTAQILWAFRMIGAIDVAPPPEAVEEAPPAAAEALPPEETVEEDAATTAALGAAEASESGTTVPPDAEPGEPPASISIPITYHAGGPPARAAGAPGDEAPASAPNGEAASLGGEGATDDAATVGATTSDTGAAGDASAAIPEETAAASPSAAVTGSGEIEAAGGRLPGPPSDLPPEGPSVVEAVGASATAERKEPGPADEGTIGLEASSGAREPEPTPPRSEESTGAGTEAVSSPLTPLEAVGTGVLEEIGRFNRRHREVYGVFKAAVGAGARNLIANCAKRTGDSTALFAGLAMDDTGAFPAEGLFERLGQLRPAEIRSRLEALIEAETVFARQLHDPPTVERLGRRLDSVASEPLVPAGH
jgi:hypothetical protein